MWRPPRVKTQQECFPPLHHGNIPARYAGTRRSRKLGPGPARGSGAEVRPSPEEFGTFFATDLDSGLTA
jgi:hypothetical protein